MIVRHVLGSDPFHTARVRPVVGFGPDCSHIDIHNATICPLDLSTGPCELSADVDGRAGVLVVERRGRYAQIPTVALH